MWWTLRGRTYSGSWIIHRCWSDFQVMSTDIWFEICMKGFNNLWWLNRSGHCSSTCPGGFRGIHTLLPPRGHPPSRWYVIPPSGISAEISFFFDAFSKNCCSCDGMIWCQHRFMAATYEPLYRVLWISLNSCASFIVRTALVLIFRLITQEHLILPHVFRQVLDHFWITYISRLTAWYG
jgi:hypothetical protein